MDSQRITAVIVTGAPLVLETGVLELSPEQAQLRAHNLAAVSGRLYRIKKPVSFKAGEQLGWVGDVPKKLAAILQPSMRAKRPAAPGAQREPAAA